MTRPGSSPIRVAVAGLGAVGLRLTDALDEGIPGFSLAAVSARDHETAVKRLSHHAHKVPVVSIAELEPLADIVVECAPSALVPQILEPFLRAGKTAIVLSAGALLDNMNLVELARSHGGRIIVPSGALLGLDAVSAAAEGNIRSVRMITRKPVRGLLGAPYLETHGIEIAGITEAKKVFSGTAAEAAVGFPANLNVVVALSLAGIGPERTTIEIWADPNLTRNTHRIEVDSDSAGFAMSIENIPTENPKTGRITALSVIACLRKMTASLVVGT